MLEAIALAEGERDLQEIRQELTDTGYLRRPSKARDRGKRVASKPMEFRSSSGLRISVGKNNTQNDLLTTKQASRVTCGSTPRRSTAPTSSCGPRGGSPT